jgi:hypothetical protein
MRLVLAVALTLLAACGGKVDGAAVDGAAGAPSDSFPVVGGRCVGAHGEIVRDACMLTEVADFTPRRWAPPSPRLGACSSAQIDAFQQKCLSADSDQLQEGTCAAFQQSAENAVCLSCLVTPLTRPLPSGR